MPSGETPPIGHGPPKSGRVPRPARSAVGGHRILLDKAR